MRNPQKWWVAATVVAVVGIGGFWLREAESAPYSGTTLSAIDSDPSRWVGVRVRITGRLLAFRNPDGTRYGALQSGGYRRMGIRRLGPWKSMVGDRVVAVGTVEFNPDFGWYLQNPRLSRSGR